MNLLVSKSEYKCPNVWAEDDDDPIGDNEGSYDTKEEKPEPDKNVDLFVDNVERKNTKSIMFLYVARSTKLVERTFGHSREDIYHRVYPILLITVGKRHHLNAVREKCTVEESVKKEHLA